MKKSQKRSDQSRINGAKSKGAITPEGQRRAATSSLKHGMYAQEETLAWTVDQERYDAHRRVIFDIWKPANAYIEKRLEILVKLIWRLDCLTAYGWDHASEMLNTKAANLPHMYEMTLEKGSLSERIDTKIRQFNREIRAMEREIEQLQKKFQKEEPTQKPQKTKAASPAPRQPHPAPPAAEQKSEPSMPKNVKISPPEPKETAPRS